MLSDRRETLYWDSFSVVVCRLQMQVLKLLFKSIFALIICFMFIEIPYNGKTPNQTNTVTRIYDVLVLPDECARSTHGLVLIQLKEFLLLLLLVA